MESIGNILGRLSKDMGLEAGRRINSIRKRWRNVVGETIASHSYPDEIRGDLIILMVETPQWMHHLTFFSEEIIQRLNPFGIKRVRFKLGKLPSPSEPAQTKEYLLSEDDKRYLEEVLASIKDEEMRERFKGLLLHALTKGRRY